MSPAVERESWVGQSLPRLEDEALLRGEGRFLDDLDPVPNAGHAAILRSQLAHARITRLDASAALDVPGVVGVLTGADVAAMSHPFGAGVDSPVPYRAAAGEIARYAGEPLAVVVARDRYVAEDALELIEVDYEPLEPVMDPLAAAATPGLVASDRSFRYGDPDAAFATAHLVVSERFAFPRWSCTPVECYGVVADWDPAARSLTAWTNFQGPFTLHSVAAAALGLPGSKLRLITPPDSGGSYGIKSAVYVYVVLMGLASRKLGAPVRWIEDRLEHLAGSSGATARITGVEAAFAQNGELIGVRYDAVEDVGAYVRAPEPATLYRMHGSLSGAYRVQNVAARNCVVLTNRCPTGLNRGFGGPQLYLALERTMAVAARRLGLDPSDLARRNLIAADSFPYRTPSGALYDSGDYESCLDDALRLARYEERRAEQGHARAAGRSFGIGIACVVEPSISNMGYITLAQPADERARSLAKSGNAEGASVLVSPLGGITVRIATTPQGQGHATVCAQIVADRLGVTPHDVDVLTDMDTSTSAWTVASGAYSSRFSGVGAGAVARAAEQVADKARRIAAHLLECSSDDVVLADGRAAVAGSAEGLSLRRIAGVAHWNPESLPPGLEPGLQATAFYAAPNLEPPDAEDRVASSAAHGFLADVAVVEVERDTGEVRVLDYATVHDAGRLLNPLIVEGQVRGGFAHGAGAALFERTVYDEDGNLLTGTFMDYLCPTAPDLPALRSAHRESPSPFTLLGAKGLGEGNTMSVPAAIANAVADALGRDDVELPLTPPRVWELLFGSRAVKPAPFEYARPASVEEAVELLGEHGDDAKVLAGGQSLVPLLNMRLARPALLIDINRVADLDNISRTDAATHVGTLVRQAGARGCSPLLDSCLPYVGHVVTRNRGTVGGSIAHADARAELPLALLALGGSVVAVSRRSRREIPAEDFFVTHFTTTLGSDELVVETVWPALPGWGVAFEEVAIRTGDFALGMAAVVLQVVEGRAAGTRVAVGSSVDRPLLLADAAALVDGQPVDEELAREAGRAAAGAVDPADTLHASAAYQKHLTSVVVERALLAAWRNATGAGA